VGVSENCALLCNHAASSVNRCVITHKRVILNYFAAEAWNHASRNVLCTDADVLTALSLSIAPSCIIQVFYWHCVISKCDLIYVNYWTRVLQPQLQEVSWIQKLYEWQTATSVRIIVFSRLLSVNEERHNKYDVVFTVNSSSCLVVSLIRK
jgi:hypothetical protein